MTADLDQTPPPPRRGFGTRMVLGLLILAFVGGAVLMAWLSQNWRSFGGGQPATSVAANSAEGEQNAAALTEPAAATSVPALAETQAGRVADLEQRMTRIAMAAQAASSNANRAEALLTAFAARRALDAGRPLGYVENTLRLRFGDAQPKAVATIINAAAEPVTLAELRLGLDDVNPIARDQSQGTGWWRGFWREIGSMAVIRKAGAPSPEPELRLLRARHAVELGQIDGAIMEMTALPPQTGVARWLELARRYNEAHRALDVIEAAAILEPRTTTALVPAAADEAVVANAAVGR